MPVRKTAPSFDELLGQFTERIDQSVRRPNIYRFKPLPQQDLFLQSQAKGRILFGGNRGGKTYGGGADDVLALTHRHPYRQHFYPDGPLRFRFIGVDFERGIDQGAIPLFKELIPPSFLVNGSWEDSYRRADHMLTLADKSTCSFMSYEQDANKFQIVSLHHTHFDEEPPKAIFEEDMLRHIDVSGTWTLSETPVQQLEWVQDELIEPTEAGHPTQYGAVEIFYLSTLENTNLPPEELANLVANMSIEDQIVRLQGKYKSGSQVFPEFERRYPFVIPEEGFRLTPEHAVYESMDHGYVNPTSWNWTAVAPDGGMVVFKQLYAKSMTIEMWAKAVKQMRKQICEQYGIPQWMYRDEMLKGTFGDPSIGDHGNASAQTGITIQQAYSIGGVYISTTGVRSVRVGNQNIGLDKFHTYFEMRPDLPSQPWLQMTDNCTALIDEVKKARKPRQTSKTAEVKNASEQIRDKDNHAIDAQKYLFIVTHDLRPAQYRGIDPLPEQFTNYFSEASREQYDTHDQLYEATMSSHRNRSGSDSYFAMEE